MSPIKIRIRTMSNQNLVQNQTTFLEDESKICPTKIGGWHNVSEEVKNVGTKMEIARLKRLEHKRQPIKKTSTLP